MKPSFFRLIISTVLVGWVVGLVVLILFARSRDWTGERIRRDGVLLVHALLDAEPPENREARLGTLREHFEVDLSLASLAAVEHRAGRRLAAGELVTHREAPREQWAFIAFHDGGGVLVAGPVDPAIPPGAFPVGLILAIVGLPLITGLIALRVQRELNKVEMASQALAVGELGARVADHSGPSAELAASFNSMAMRVERLIRNRDELVQAVSHELGSPLARLRFHVELLDDLSEEEREARLRSMTRELDALDELVAELLSYVQSDEMQIERTTFEPRRVLADLAELAELAELEAPEGRAVKVELEIPERSEVLADQRLFQRAIENLLRNAVHHAKGRVLLRLTEDDASIRVAVHDDGPGIPEALREKVTIPFFRAEPNRDRRTGGAGLGLAIVSRIMQRHGGRLEIDTSPLGGARVATVWPRNT
ncbi:MAG: hypothetical protein IPG45_35685 [Deltaproteobacteria bacterium]|nr:hypothetical protein [Deltaproteobacteria bacterium]